MDALRRTRSFQPVLTDIRTIAPSGWYGDPTKATVEKGKEMVKTLSNKIAKVSEEILDTLEKTQGKPKKIKTLK